MPPSARAEVVSRRSYHRPYDMDDESKGFETWPEVVERSIDHTTWLWERQLNRPLTRSEQSELHEVRDLMLDRAALAAGRTLWLGGTDKVKSREASMFNCAFTEVATVADIVDIFHLLLQGCGVGFKPVPGSLFSFNKPISFLHILPSTRTEPGDPLTRSVVDGDHWTLIVGDSAEGWAKAMGKLLAHTPIGITSLTLDFTEVRPAGKRLKGYGWICHGYAPLASAMAAIFRILNENPGKPLTRADIHNIINHLGTVLSTRRSAQLCLCDSDDSDATNFALFKKDMNANGEWHKGQSNNTTSFYDTPDYRTINAHIDLMVESGGSEPGIRNADYSLRRAPWSKGCNPCAEILLPNKGFCNLVEINEAHPLFLDPIDGYSRLCRAVYVMARFNYRQTCVNLKDGILQDAWHENNHNLRLCGVGLTGLALRPDLTPPHFQELRQCARRGADSMADELGTPRSALVTTVKPSGTLSKIMDTTEGFHQPLGRYILNRVNFSAHDLMLPKLRDAGYNVQPHPTSPSSFLVDFPIDYGIDIIQETAVQQLYRYKMLMENWCDHNVSCTIYYEPHEVNDIKRWLYIHWNSYVAVSFLPRNPTATYDYFPQRAITADDYAAAVAPLRPIVWGHEGNLSADDDGCANGACPIK